MNGAQWAYHKNTNMQPSPLPSTGLLVLVWSSLVHVYLGWGLPRSLWQVRVTRWPDSTSPWTEQYGEEGLSEKKNTTTGRRSQFVRQLYVLGVNRSAFLRGRVTGFEVWGLDMFMFTGSLKYVTRLYGMYYVVRTFHRSANHCQFCNSIITSMFLEFCNSASHNEARVQQLHLVAINKMLPHLFITWLLIMQAGFMWCFIPQI